jgi:H+/Cl- antiporter ClcA
MKAYLITTCAIFGLIALAHVWRVVEEGMRLAREPWFVLLTLAAVGLCAWAFWLLQRMRQS